MRVVREALTARIPEGRLAAQQEVAEAIYWLVPPATSYVNGTTLTVDGGETAGVMLSIGYRGRIEFVHYAPPSNRSKCSSSLDGERIGKECRSHSSWLPYIGDI